MELASGQLIEFFTTFEPAKARHLYDERIYRKTASLFRTSAESGAILSGAPEEQVQALRDYGCNIGMAFQIVDDLLDVQGDASAIGKPVGNDLMQGVLTLPAIMLMERYPEEHPIDALFASIKNGGEGGDAERLLARSLAMINDSGIIPGLLCGHSRLLCGGGGGAGCAAGLPAAPFAAGNGGLHTGTFPLKEISNAYLLGNNV